MFIKTHVVLLYKPKHCQDFVVGRLYRVCKSWGRHHSPMSSAVAVEFLCSLHCLCPGAAPWRKIGVVPVLSLPKVQQLQ